VCKIYPSRWAIAALGGLLYTIYLQNEKEEKKQLGGNLLEEKNKGRTPNCVIGYRTRN